MQGPIQVRLEALLQQLLVHAIDKCPLASEPITTQTDLLTLRISRHTEHLSLCMTRAPELCLFLGFPWLQKHNLQIDLAMESVVVWGSQCPQSCLRGTLPSVPPHLACRPSWDPKTFSLSRF
ncbi:uncharacterized protein LOC102210904 [Tachysurus ichikawai]